MEKIKGSIFVDKTHKRILFEADDIRDEKQISEFLASQGIDAIGGDDSQKIVTMTWRQAQTSGGLRYSNRKLEIQIHRD